MTKPAEGPFSGSGPKGYKRPPDSIEGQVCDALRADGYVNASAIDVEVTETGDVTLSGKVPSREQQRRAEESIASIQGVGAVHNRLEIDSDMDESGGRSGSEFGRDRETAQRPATTIGAEPKGPKSEGN